jgi:chaperone BCS1
LQCADFEQALSKSKRSWESVILDGSTAEDVYQDCAKFLESHDWYNALGVPYRRSFLIESPPGCGKSSFIQALAGRLGFDICFLSLSAGDWNDTELVRLLSFLFFL